MLRDVLLYHGVQGPLYAGQIVAGIMTDGSFRTASALGDNLVFTLTDQGLFINDNVQLIYPDIRTSDGIIHVISGILMPPSE
jgi:transforming growth factor-beta-induced protein